MLITEEGRPSAVTIESTYKAREVEGVLDLYFYRRVGFWLACLFARMRLTPIAVTVMGGIFGVAAGHLYYYPDLRLNVIGMALHVCANAFDNADGQLARLTSTQSRAGRIIDSYADHFVWLSVYVHLTFRCVGTSGSSYVYLLGIAAALSHGLQGAAADYYRTTYLYFLKGGAGGELDRSDALAEEYRAIAWTDLWRKFLVFTHRNYTSQQEMLSPGLCRLRDHLSVSQSESGLQVKEYLPRARPAFKWWGFLMTNTRMIILFLCLCAGRPILYFWLELTAANLLLLVLIRRQESLSRDLLP